MTRPVPADDTIVAIATPPGEGGIGVVRLSGPRSVPVADSIFRGRHGRVEDQKNFTARYGHVVERSDSGERVIDEALLLLMRAPKSYTGEDVVELSVHGGPAVLQAVLKLSLEAGARLAEPGEFTKRAFLNGRMDLVQAEAVLDLVRAKTERTRAWAMSQLEGALSKKMKLWKDELVDVLSHLEASLDFPEDFPDTQTLGRLADRLEEVSSALQTMLRDSELVFVAKRGLRVVLWGRPNVGKSSLMNRLTRTERVIVTPYPGTTRDVIEEESAIGGFAVRFQDTAGIRETAHPIEKEGVERSRKAMQGADLVLLVLDSSEVFCAEDEALTEEVRGQNGIVVLNKSDLRSAMDIKEIQSRTSSAWPVVRCSCITEDGTEALEKAVLSLILNGRVEAPAEAVIGTARQKDLLEKFSNELQAASTGCRQGLSPELIAYEVRAALDRLGELAGEVLTDDVLEVLFKQFCIGK